MRTQMIKKWRRYILLLVCFLLLGCGSISARGNLLANKVEDEEEKQEQEQNTISTEKPAEEENTEILSWVEYEYSNSDVAHTIVENVIHDISVEVGDQKKLKISKDSKKTVKVNEVVYDQNDNILSSKVRSCKFGSFQLESWKSSNDQVVKISKSEASSLPTLTARAPGIATIEIVYSYTNSKYNLKAYYQSKATVTVNAAYRDIGLAPATIIRGESITYKPNLPDRTNSYTDRQGNFITETCAPESVTWSSSSGKASVENGKVEGLLEGTATITLKYKYMFTDGSVTCTDKVKVTINCYTVNGEVINIQASVAEDEDAAPTINAACAFARDHATDETPYVIKFEKGTYKLASSTIRLFSNTILDMRDGAVLQFAGVGGAEGSRKILMLGTNGAFDGEESYNSSAKCAGYKGYRNIKILGGTIESTKYNKSTHIVMAHATNVLFEDVTITGGAGMHMMEIAAIDGFTMRNCVFENFTGSKSISANKNTGRVAYAYRPGNYEALQFDVAASEECLGGVYMDGTPMKNVNITGCRFDGVPRGIGIHTQVLGSYHDNVNISENTFVNTVKEAILLLAFRNCTINDNIIKNCGAGITVQSFSNNPTYVMTRVFEGTKEYGKKAKNKFNIQIVRNNISVKNRGAAIIQAGISVMGFCEQTGRKTYRPANEKLWGVIPKGDYYIGDVTVEDNQIETSGLGIYLTDAKRVVVNNNRIQGIQFPNKSIYNGIYANDATSLDELSGNEISAMQGNGISISSTSNVKGTIENNTIKKVSYCAIKFDNIKNPVTVQNNIFQTRSKTSSVIYLATGAENKNRITFIDNSISGATGSKGVGVFVESGTHTIEKNKIAKAKIGIYIRKAESSCKLSENIFRSTVKKKKKVEK